MPLDKNPSLRETKIEPLKFCDKTVLVGRDGEGVNDHSKYFLWAFFHKQTNKGVNSFGMLKNF